jgi:hypothetical protein
MSAPHRTAASMLVVAGLLNLSWSNNHKPDLQEVLAALGRPPYRSRHRISDALPPAAAAPERHKPTGPAGGDARSDIAPHDASHATSANAAAQRFVDIALGGGFGEHYRRAAELGVTLAIEHGFDDDPQRVAEAVVIFIDPRHR